MIDQLTDHQKRILALICQGYTSHKQLARALGITRKTTERHVYNINETLGTSGLAQIALIAAACGVPLATPEQIIERNRVV